MTTEVSDQEVREDFINSLRELADWLEQTPTAPVPYYNSIGVHLSTKEDAIELAKNANGIEKSYTEDHLSLVKKFGHIIRYRAIVNRNKVCTVKSKRTELREVDDYSQVPKVTKEIEVIEWDCDPLLAGNGLNEGSE